MDTKNKAEILKREYRRKVAEIRSTSSLSWEKKELAVRRLGQQYDKARKVAEKRRQS